MTSLHGQFSEYDAFDGDDDEVDMTSEEGKAVEEEIRWEEVRVKMIAAWRETCLEPHYCDAAMLPTWCDFCKWDARTARSKIEQLSESS